MDLVLTCNRSLHILFIGSKINSIIKTLNLRERNKIQHITESETNANQIVFLNQIIYLSHYQVQEWCDISISLSSAEWCESSISLSSAEWCDISISLSSAEWCDISISLSSAEWCDKSIAL